MNLATELKERINTEAQAAERTAVYNLAEIRKLEKRLNESDVEAIGWIEAAQDINGVMRGDIIRLMQHATELQNEVTELQELRKVVQMQARRVTVLIGLVERMGRDLDVHYGDLIAHRGGSLVGYAYTLIGQREYDAAMHEEG